MSQQPMRDRNRPSDEATAPQLTLAQKQGEAFGRALQAMSEMDSHGRAQRAGDYLVGYEVEEAEGMYVPDGNGLLWSEPQQENAHLEVVVRDADDGRFVPGLKVHARLMDAGGKEVGAHELPFLWHPWLFHYGRNLQVPKDGTYSLHIHIDPPQFPRHDKVNGKRYASPVDVHFDQVQVETGQKR
ncbi:MAG TPA: iron transporter [Acetobacteraceae bacterium]|nr:iron transporter [Acetobacteraceae bacterium]